MLINRLVLTLLCCKKRFKPVPIEHCGVQKRNRQALGRRIADSSQVWIILPLALIQYVLVASYSIVKLAHRSDARNVHHVKQSGQSINEKAARRRLLKFDLNSQVN